MATTIYHKAFDSVQADSPSWLQEIRKDGFVHFERVGWPTRKHEEWKYTSTRDLEEQDFQIATWGGGVDEAALDAVRVAQSLEIVFVDGLFRADLSRLSRFPEGVRIETLKQPLKAGPLDWLASLETEGSVFAGLNAALFQDGLFVEVTPKTVCEPLIHVIHLFSEEAGQAMVFPRQVIKMGTHAQASLLQTIVSGDTDKTLLDAVTDVDVAENAQLSYAVMQAEGGAASQVQNTKVHLHQDSRLDAFVLTLGGKWVRNDLHVTLDGSNIDAKINGVYATDGERHVDNHTVIDHREPHSTSSQLYKGILKDKSQAVFNGKIFVRDVAQQTAAYQLNQNLLLSPSAEVDTKPQLEIFADDVRCTHGATIGPVNPDELFYLASRGISHDQAIQMLSQGFARDAIAQVSDQRIQDALDRCFVRAYDRSEV